MWSRTYSQIVTGVSADRLWQAWADVDRWSAWQDDIEYARLAGPFAVGTTFELKPKGAPRVRIELVDVQPRRAFVDRTRFPLAQMYGTHEFIPQGDGLEVRTTMSVRGQLAFLWARLVARGIVDGLAAQTASLVAYARALPEAPQASA